MIGRSFGVPSLCLLAVCLVVGCASTTIVDTTSSTTTGLGPDGSTPLTTVVDADLLDEMVRLTLGLGNEIVDGDSRTRLAAIEELWAEARDRVDDVDPALGREIDHQLEIITTAVDRKRPADADKAAGNLATVVQAIHDRTP